MSATSYGKNDSSARAGRPNNERGGFYAIRVWLPSGALWSGGSPTLTPLGGGNVAVFSK